MKSSSLEEIFTFLRSEGECILRVWYEGAWTDSGDDERWTYSLRDMGISTRLTFWERRVLVDGTFDLYTDPRLQGVQGEDTFCVELWDFDWNLLATVVVNGALYPEIGDALRGEPPSVDYPTLLLFLEHSVCFSFNEAHYDELEAVLLL